MQRKTLPVSIIIPFSGQTKDLCTLLRALEISTAWAAEIIVISSEERNHNINDLVCNEFNSNLDFLGIVNIILSSKTLFPGAARNIGILKSSKPVIAFLDTNTIPNIKWLEKSYDLINNQEKINMILGMTKYTGNTFIKKLFITATYGELPLKTIPGSIMKRSTLFEIGLFIPTIRAAEDTDWIVRASQFGYINKNITTPVLQYDAIPNNIIQMSKKWFRNYYSCAAIVFHLEKQKLIYFMFGNTIALYIAFTWNYLFAKWDTSSLLYFPNITKLTFSLIILSYFVLRGIIMPLKRGTSINNLLPLRWFMVTLICLVLDISKLSAYVTSLMNPIKTSCEK
tara:strand:+ start:480 stop:1499 length:1020 start_codon:yes stop_codon:yes gene_type:complete